MSINNPAVKTVITKKSPDIIITEDGNNIVLNSTDGTSDAGGKIFGNDILLIERFWADDVIKFSGTYSLMIDALVDEDIGATTTLEEFTAPEHTHEGTSIWYWSNGNKYKEYEFKDGWLHGSYKIWWEDGEKNTIGERSTTWKDDRTPSPVHIEGDNVEQRIGTWEYYDEEGNKTETVWSE
jgi:hypothetical protein